MSPPDYSGLVGVLVNHYFLHLTTIKFYPTDLST